LVSLFIFLIGYKDTFHWKDEPILQQKCDSKLIKDSGHSLNDSISASFDKAISLLKTIELPYKLYCGVDDNDYIFYSQCPDLIKSIFPKNERIDGIVGKINGINDNNIFIIFTSVGDIIYPYLYTFNKQGKIIDSLYLHISYCVADGSEIVSTQTIMNSDYSIDMTDTIKYIHYPKRVTKTSVKDYVVDSIEIENRTFILNRENKFTVSKKEHFTIN